MAKLHIQHLAAAAAAVVAAARPVDDNTPPRPLHARSFDQLRPYQLLLVRSIVDEVRWVGNLARQMRHDRYRAEKDFGVGRRTVDRE